MEGFRNINTWSAVQTFLFDSCARDRIIGFLPLDAESAESACDEILSQLPDTEPEHLTDIDYEAVAEAVNAELLP